MSPLTIRIRKAVTLLASAAALAGSLATSNVAGAKPIWMPKPFPGPMYKPGPKFGGYGAAAFAGGLALGAIAASAAAESESDCYIARQRMIDNDRNEYFARVRVCE